MCFCDWMVLCVVLCAYLFQKCLIRDLFKLMPMFNDDISSGLSVLLN